MSGKSTFNYEITEHIAILSTNGNKTKELNKVSYNGSKPKYDLRGWTHEDGEEKLLKGLTLTTEEARLLKEALEAREDL